MYRVLIQDQVAIISFTNEDTLFVMRMTKLNWTTMMKRFASFFEVINQFDAVTRPPDSIILMGLKVFQTQRFGTQQLINKNLLFEPDKYINGSSIDEEEILA